MTISRKRENLCKYIPHQVPPSPTHMGTSSAVGMVPVILHPLVVAQVGIEPAVGRCVLLGEETQVPLKHTESRDNLRCNVTLKTQLNE